MHLLTYLFFVAKIGKKYFKKKQEYMLLDISSSYSCCLLLTVHMTIIFK